MGSRVTCTHCETEFTPEVAAAFDDCPVCGRTVAAQPAPAPLPEEVAFAIGQIEDSLGGSTYYTRDEGVYIHAGTDYVRAILAHITAQARRLAEVEAELAEASAAAHRHKAAFKEQAVQLRAEEARVRELEVALGAVYPMAIAHAATYQQRHALPRTHPRHQEALDLAQAALAATEASA